jgi:uncharacterized protein with GYD domain
MPVYIGLLRWTDQGAQSVKEALNRRRQAAERIEQLGGRMLASYWTQGAYDFVAIMEYPDDETAAAGSLGAGMQGNIRSETMRAFDEQEMQRILQKLS